MRYVKLLSFILAVGLFFSGCASSTQGGTLGTDRKQLMLVSSSQMDAGAKQAYAQVLNEAKTKRTLNPNKAQTKRVRDIAERIIKQVSIFRSDAAIWDWQVNVIKDKQLNAWCMPGGKIAVYTGIIETLKLTDAELSAIMGHEIAHALREHSRERASNEQLKGIGLIILQKATGAGKTEMKLAQMASHYTVSLPFSRGHEREADQLGIELMARAGYNPNAAVNVWKKMMKVSKSSPIELLSTHPSPQSRIDELSVLAKKVYPLYIKAKGK